MLQRFEENPVLYGAVIVLLLVLALLVVRRMRKPAQRSYRPDVLDEGVAPAARNQALIDAAPAVQVPGFVAPPAAEILGGIGEAVAAAAREEVAAAQVAAPEPVPPTSADDLSRIKGLGPKLKALLEGLGVTSFAQIAGWSQDDLIRIDAQLGTFAGRPERDNWIEQAKMLAAGDVAGFEDRFGKV
jgi:predicted flap endonuclease-1-like 5' DNA nuclease